MSNTLSRRRLVVALGATGLAALSAACGGGLPTPTAKPAEKPASALAPTKPAEAPKPAAAAEPTKPAAAGAATKPAAAAEPTKPAAAGAATKPAEAPRPAAAPATADQVSVEFWFWADDPYQASLHTDSLKKFQEKNPKVAVKTDFISTVADQRKKLLTSFAAQAGMPDISHSTGGWLPEFNDAKMLVPLEPRLKNWKTFEDWLPAIQRLAKGRPNDQVGMVANQILVPYLYYRADWLEEAKLKPPDTLDQVVEVAKALTKAPERYGYGFRGGDGGSLGQQVGLYLKGSGVDFVKDDGTVDLDSPDAVGIMEWYAGLVTKHKVTQPSALTDRFPELFAGLQSGKLALLHHGLWSWKTQESVLKEKVSAAPVPQGTKKRFVHTDVEGTMMYATSKKQDQGWEVAAFLGEPEQTKLFMHERGSGPVLKSMLDDKILKENRFYKAAIDSQPAWSNFPNYHPNWPKMADRWGPEIQRLVKGETNPERFCKTMADILRKG